MSITAQRGRRESPALQHEPSSVADTLRLKEDLSLYVSLVRSSVRVIDPEEASILNGGDGGSPAERMRPLDEYE